MLRMRILGPLIAPLPQAGSRQQGCAPGLVPPMPRQPDSLMWALPTVCGAGGQSPWRERLLCPLSGSLCPSTPFPPPHVASYCLSAVISARPHSTSGHPSWPKVCHWAAIAVPLITAHPKGTLSNGVLRAT